jgi:Tfp pilus assembly protein PilE
LKTRFFSLIELLVVFAILAILMSLLQPTMQKVIKSADTLACANHLHHFYNIFVYYTDDHDGRFTAYGRQAPGSMTPYMWFTKLENYHDKDDQVRVCPSTDISKNNSNWGTSSLAWKWDRRPGSYAFNSFFHSDTYDRYTYQLNTSATFDNIYFKSFSRVIKPSETGLLADSSWVDAWPRNFQVGPSSAAIGGQAGETSMARLTVNRHEWATNVLKADGSAKKHQLEELWSDIYWNLQDKPKPAPTINP